MSDDEIAEIAERMEATDPTAAFWREFARSVLAAHEAKKQQPDHLSADCVACAATVPAWQDIATAPRDGATLLGWVVAPPVEYSDGFEAASLIYWDQGFAHSFGRRAPGWVKQWRGEVTHWMPLPEPPKD